MSITKQYRFALAGVASQVGFGKGGNQLVSNSFGFSTLDAAGNIPVAFQVADPVNQRDAVTLQFLSNVTGGIIANVVSLNNAVVSLQSMSNTATLLTNIGLVQANLAAEVIRANAAEARITANVISEVARANTAELVLSNAITAIQTAYVKADGSTPFTANVSLGGHQVQNIGAPVRGTDSVNLTTLTARINALGSVFTYVGTVAPGASIDAVFNLAQLHGPDGTAPVGAGNYYKPRLRASSRPTPLVRPPSSCNSVMASSSPQAGAGMSSRMSKPWSAARPT
jgi:hypothetical protein